MLFAVALALSGKEPVRAPEDIDRLNRFATAYNRYAEELRAGVVDVKQWEAVEKAWKAVR